MTKVAPELTLDASQLSEATRPNATDLLPQPTAPPPPRPLPKPLTDFKTFGNDHFQKSFQQVQKSILNNKDDTNQLLSEKELKLIRFISYLTYMQTTTTTTTTTTNLTWNGWEKKL
ncbi:unnamed protein product [Rotaria sordida]|uniref:Uncharacterized protein n=1 Tax=Rotaria sordida TaxID=392033 RepID=A0A819J4N9_9BILA|nr:unnamed protein product [Rotaria sordida]